MPIPSMDQDVLRLAPPGFSLERSDPEMAYTGLRCSCGGAVFRLIGWPRLAAGRGGLLRRTLARIWREAREITTEGEPEASPFLLPIALHCDHCAWSSSLLESLGERDRDAAADRALPTEAYRCRSCRRSRVELVVGRVPGDRDLEACDAAELIVRCRACGRRARIAWADTRPSVQQVRLDRLAGRR